MTLSAPSDLVYNNTSKDAKLSYSNWPLGEVTIAYNNVDRVNVTGNDITASITLSEGDNAKTDKFAVKIDGEVIELNQYNSYTISGLEKDVEITVEGVALETCTVTYKADGNVVSTVEVEHGKDAYCTQNPCKRRLYRRMG